MYEQEIHEAIEQRDMKSVWELMFRRTAWIQNNTFSPSEAETLAIQTVEIRDRLVSFQQETKDQMAETVLRQHAVQAYGKWR